MIMTIFFILIVIVIVIVIVTVIVIVIVVVIVIVLMGLFNNQANNSSQPDGVDLDGPYPKEDAMFQIPIHV